MKVLVAILAAISTLLVAIGARAHEVRPALLQITETQPGLYEIFWKQPAMGEAAVRLSPKLGSGWLDQPPTDQYVGPGFLVRKWVVRSRTPLAGQRLTVEGLSGTITDVMVRAKLADDSVLDAVLKPTSPGMDLTFERHATPAVAAYLTMGVRHILTGVDHLAFVLGLLLLVGPNRHLIKAITAFTVAHSLTLAAAALGWVHAPSAIVEALVALSIVFVAAELLRTGPSLTLRHPWIVAFLFGLLHGLAFAGALAEVGLPPRSVAAALFLFNLGVEIGQMIFVGALVGLLLLGRRLLAGGPALQWPALRLAPSYLIGSFAAFWFLERVAAVFQ